MRPSIFSCQIRSTLKISSLFTFWSRCSPSFSVFEKPYSSRIDLLCWFAAESAKASVILNNFSSYEFRDALLFFKSFSHFCQSIVFFLIVYVQLWSENNEFVSSLVEVFIPGKRFEMQINISSLWALVNFGMNLSFSRACLSFIGSKNLEAQVDCQSRSTNTAPDRHVAATSSSTTNTTKKNWPIKPPQFLNRV